MIQIKALFEIFASGALGFDFAILAALVELQSPFNCRNRFRITIFGEPTREFRQNENLSVGGGAEDYVERVVVSLGLEERVPQSLRRVGSRN